MKKLFIKDLERRFSFSPAPITTHAQGEEGIRATTLAVGEEGKSSKPIVTPPFPRK